MIKPNVFIGSSSEGIETARAVQYHLRDAALANVWNDGVFGLSTGTLETLVQLASRFDFAVLVLTPDDVVSRPNGQQQAPRDNVMFELGLFMGALGRNRTFALCSNDSALRLPSDLAGVTVARFDSSDAIANLTAAVGPACFQIRRAIRELGALDRVGTNADVAQPLDAAVLADAITLAELRCTPERPRRGDTLTLEYDVECSLKSIRVWFGANLVKDGRCIFNVAEDTEAVLALGPQTHRRYLSIPADIEPGEYGLQIEVWFGQCSIPSRSIPLVARWPDRKLAVE